MIVVNRRGNSGFSLIELLTVVILLGIIGVVALGRLGNQSAVEARGFFDDTVTAVRFAQKLAVSTGCGVRVVTTASSYQVRQSSSCAAGDYVNPVQNPANRGQNYQNVNMPDGFSLTAGNITFDPIGVRQEGSSTFTLSDGTTSFSFEAHETGLVEVL